MMKTFFEKFFLNFIQESSTVINYVVLCFCYGLVTALCFALPMKEWNGISMLVVGTLVGTVLICHHLVLQMYSL